MAYLTNKHRHLQLQRVVIVMSTPRKRD